MNTQTHILKPFIMVGIITGILLLIPMIAMQYSTEVNWSSSDFILMGILLFSTGSAFVIFTSFSKNLVYKAAMVLAIISTFLLVWANLAVGLIGSGPHAGNLMYGVVLLIGMIGTFRSHFTAKGMQSTMFAMAASFVVLTIIALLANMQDYPGSSITEIIMVNTFFASLFLLAGFMFRFVAIKENK